MSAEHLNECVQSLNKWLQETLGSCKRLSSLPVVRSFLDLDHPLIKEEEEEEEPEEDQMTDQKE